MQSRTAKAARPPKKKAVTLRIIIVGCGKVGYTLTEQLVREGHDITVVDTNERVISDVSDVFDVMGICGNGASHRVLMDCLLYTSSTTPASFPRACMASKRGRAGPSSFCCCAG